MNTSYSSVVCLLDAKQQAANHVAISFAHNTALNMQLPFAVAVSIDQKPDQALKSIRELLPLEAELAKNNIPLICLLAPKKIAIESVTRYMKPLLITTKDTPSGYKATKLTKHQISWPGAVLPLQYMLKNFDSLKC